MIDLSTIDDEKLSIGMRLLRDAILAKGWVVQVPYVGSSHCFIDRKNGREPLHIFSSTPPGSSWPAGHIANDKFATYVLLNEQGINQPETISISDSSFGSDIAQAKQLIERHGKIVIKPLDGGHGQGITVNIEAEKELLDAIKYARQFSRLGSDIVIAQQMLKGLLHDARIIVIGGEFVAAVKRIPAAVTGDGKKNLLQLIEFENSTFRGEPYYAKLAKINTEAAKKFLGERINYVPAKSERVTVMGIANYGQGGELVDITDDIPSWLSKEAEKIAHITGLPVCGVDYLSLEPLSQATTPGDFSVFCIEVNKCPSLAIHDCPTIGKDRGAVKAYVEYLETI